MSEQFYLYRIAGINSLPDFSIINAEADIMSFFNVITYVGTGGATAGGVGVIAILFVKTGAGGASGAGAGVIKLTISITPSGGAAGSGAGVISISVVHLGDGGGEGGGTGIVDAFELTGTTLDENRALLGFCTVKLFRTETDELMDETTSDVAGAYTFLMPADVGTYYIVAYKPGSPDVAGTSVNTLRPVAL